MRTDGLRDLRELDAGDVEMYSGGDHSIAFADAGDIEFGSLWGHGRRCTG